MTNVVISQPMFIPWLGLFEQIKLADVYVHYDDVQLPQGRSFMSRVQIKTSAGSKWLTASIDRKNSGDLINEAILLESTGWRRKHLETLRHNYSNAPYVGEMLELAVEIYGFDTINLADFNCNAIEVIAQWLNLNTRFERSSCLNIKGSSTKRLLDICQYFDADQYTTGHGALNYLDHEMFDNSGIDVMYIQYEKKEYEQLFNGFTPYVTILDVIANCGTMAYNYLCSATTGWREMVSEN